MEVIKLNKIRNNGMWTEVTCSITEKLDELANLKEREFYPHYRHYMVIDTEKSKTVSHGLTCIAIRVPGVTSGCISVDDDNTIKEIEIYTYRATVPKYQSDFNEVLREFIGQKLEAKTLAI